MPPRGPIKVRLLKVDPDPAKIEDSVADTIELPSVAVVDAGMKKFREYANLHWPAGRVIGTGELKLASFDHRNDEMLKVALAMTFIAMRDAERSG